MFHVKHEGWTHEDLSPRQLADLGLYEDLLLAEAIPRGMVAASDGGHLRTRHILDSLRGVPHLPMAAERVVDLGSGAGLPGIPVAVALPALGVTLCEPRQARIAFLELTIERLDLANAQVFPRAAEELTSAFDACLARGFGDARRSWGIAREVLNRQGCLIYWAGRTFRAADAPTDARARTVANPALESGGPIVIMTRE
jgi:16S rRNA (guanine527-N7)-methyltransferase